MVLAYCSWNELQLYHLDLCSIPARTLLLLFGGFFLATSRRTPASAAQPKPPFWSPSDPSLRLVGTARWTHSERGGGWFEVCAWRTHALAKGSTQPGARDHMRPAVSRLAVAPNHRMRFPAGSALLRIRALPVPVDKLHSGCRSLGLCASGEEGLRASCALAASSYRHTT